MASTELKHPVFVLGGIYNGYGVIRSLSKHGIKVVGFLQKGIRYESFSLLPKKMVTIGGTHKDYYDILVREAAVFGKYKPVLVLTSDLYHDFVSEYYDELKKHFIFEIPLYNNLKQYLEKDHFNELAKEINLKMPYGFDINKTEGFEHVLPLLTYPSLLKPKYRNAEWIKRYGNTKVLVVNNVDEFRSVISEVFDILDQVVVQEWIPGPDSNVYYCLAYISESGKVISSFCGRKIHQLPILVGSTASAVAVDEPQVYNETIRILNRPGNFGFCSVEFKKHADTGEFYVIEPTVGRIDTQEYTAVLGGSDIVFDAYCYLTGSVIANKNKRVENYYFIEELSEIEACFEYVRHGELTWGNYFKKLRQYKVRFMFLNYRDPFTSLLVMAAMAKHVFINLFFYKIPAKASEHNIEKLFTTFENSGFL